MQSNFCSVCVRERNRGGGSGVQVSTGAREGTGLPGAGVTDSCEWLDMDDGT